jgi:hypothetical protein
MTLRGLKLILFRLTMRVGVRFEVFTVVTMKNGVFWYVDISLQRVSVASYS